MNHETASGARLMARMSAQSPTGTITLTEQLTARTEEVWSGLTSPQRLALWLGDIDGQLAIGRRYRLHYHASGADGAGTIMACNAPDRFEVRTTDLDGSNPGSLTVELTANSAGTRLVAVQQGLPLAWLPAYAAGYQVHIEDLAAHLASRGRCDSDARMNVLVPLYERQPIA